MTIKTQADIHTLESLIEHNTEFSPSLLSSIFTRFIDIAQSLQDEIDELENEINRVGVKDEY